MSESNERVNLTASDVAARRWRNFGLTMTALAALTMADACRSRDSISHAVVRGIGRILGYTFNQVDDSTTPRLFDALAEVEDPEVRRQIEELLSRVETNPPVTVEFANREPARETANGVTPISIDGSNLESGVQFLRSDLSKYEMDDFDFPREFFLDKNGTVLANMKNADGIEWYTSLDGETYNKTAVEPFGTYPAMNKPFTGYIVGLYHNKRTPIVQIVDSEKKR